MENSQQRSSRVIVEELVDEILRLRGRVLSQARDMNEKRGLGGYSQGLILTAVVRAVEPPTVAKIARSLGLTRQSVQRTANELAERELVVFEDNPHHKRAKQLVPLQAASPEQAARSIADELFREGPLLRPCDPNAVTGMEYVTSSTAAERAEAMLARYEVKAP